MIKVASLILFCLFCASCNVSVEKSYEKGLVEKFKYNDKEFHVKYRDIKIDFDASKIADTSIVVIDTTIHGVQIIVRHLGLEQYNLTVIPKDTSYAIRTDNVTGVQVNK